MRFRIFIMIFFLLLMRVLPLSASQKNDVTGTVLSKTDRSPLAGASVSVKELPGSGTVTDESGKYSLEIPADRELTLQVSYMGSAAAAS